MPHLPRSAQSVTECFKTQHGNELGGLWSACAFVRVAAGVSSLHKMQGGYVMATYLLFWKCSAQTARVAVHPQSRHHLVINNFHLHTHPHTHTHLFPSPPSQRTAAPSSGASIRTRVVQKFVLGLDKLGVSGSGEDARCVAQPSPLTFCALSLLNASVAVEGTGPRSILDPKP